MLAELSVICGTLVAISALLCASVVIINYFREKAQVEMKKISGEYADKWDKRRIQ